MSYLTYDFGSSAGGSRHDAMALEGDETVTPPISPTQSLSSPSSSIGNGAAAMEGVSSTTTGAMSDMRMVTGHTLASQSTPGLHLTPPLGGVTPDVTIAPSSANFITPLGSPTSSSSTASSTFSSPTGSSLGGSLSEPPALQRKKNVRFDAEVKSHDGLCRRAAVLDRLIHQYFVLQQEISELDVLALTASLPETVQDLHDDLVELCTRIEEAAKAGVQAEPVLARGGGMNTKLTSAHVSYLRILDQVVVAAKARALRNGASFQFQTAEEL